MATKFDYNKAKLEMEHNRRQQAEEEMRLRTIRETTAEEMAREKLAEERAREQADVDAVLYAAPGDRIRGETTEQTETTEQIEEVKPEQETDTEIPAQKPVAKPESVQDTRTIRQKLSGASIGFAAEDPLVGDFAKQFSEPDDSEPITDTSVVVQPVKEEEPPKPVEQVKPKTEPVVQTVNPVTQKPQPKPKSKPKAKPKASAKDTSDDEEDIATSVLKKFPSDIVQQIQMYFPPGTSKNDAVAAYTYIALGQPSNMDIPEAISDLCRAYRGPDFGGTSDSGSTGNVGASMDMLSAMQATLERMQVNERKLMQKLSAVEMAVAFIIFDRLGFKKKNGKLVGDIDFMENGMTELNTNLERQSEAKTLRDKQREGRPIR